MQVPLLFPKVFQPVGRESSLPRLGESKQGCCLLQVTSKPVNWAECFLSLLSLLTPLPVCEFLSSLAFPLGQTWPSTALVGCLDLLRVAFSCVGVTGICVTLNCMFLFVPFQLKNESYQRKGFAASTIGKCMAHKHLYGLLSCFTSMYGTRSIPSYLFYQTSGTYFIFKGAVPAVPLYY